MYEIRLLSDQQLARSSILRTTHAESDIEKTGNASDSFTSWHKAKLPNLCCLKRGI